MIPCAHPLWRASRLTSRYQIELIEKDPGDGTLQG